MSEKTPMPGDREPRAAGTESSDREGRIVARASGIAAAVALASIGLAYVAAQAGMGDTGALATGVPQGDRGTRVSAPVPEVDSPAVDAESDAGTVTVRPDPVAPTQALDPDVSRERAATTAVSGSGGDRPAGEYPPPANHSSPGDDGDVPASGEGGWVEWRRWWHSQRDSWEETLHDLPAELDTGSGGTEFEQFDWTGDPWDDLDRRDDVPGER